LAVGVLCSTLALGARAAHAQAHADEEPEIAIRPFGTAPPATATGTPASAATAAAEDAVGAEPVAIAIDVGGGRLYWAEMATGAIRSAKLDGTDARAVVEKLDAPVAIALDPADRRIYWATDGNFPRRIQRARLDGSEVETLVVGEDLNRPGAIALNLSAKQIYWVESVSGRVRRADLDGASIDNVIDERILTSFGLAVHAAQERMYWTDLTHARIQGALLDGSKRGDVVDESDGLDVPTGLALDENAGTIYWADRGAGSISRAQVDGSGVKEVAGGAAGVVDPRALALDAAAGKLYWSDLATDEIRRAALDGSGAETVVALPSGFASTVVVRVRGAAAAPVASCRDALERSGRRYAQKRYKTLVTCLDKMSWVKAVKWRADEPSFAAATCARSLGSFAPGAPEHAARAELSEALTAARSPVAPASNLGLLEIDRAGTVCSGAGAATLAQWIECVETRYETLVLDAVAARYPRALEWLEEAKPFAAALAAKADAPFARAGVAGIDAVYARIAERAPRTPERPPGFPATGLVTTYAANKNDGVDRAVAVPDDGAVEAGAPLRYRDNGDGTVTDLNTGLMWEKKCDACGGLHDSLTGYRWSGKGDEDDTIWDWLDDLNSEGGKGFAGHADWRIPNVKELVSIVTYERFNPAVLPAFDGASCGLGCTDVKVAECSCTASGAYWSATTFSDFPAHALMVLFNLGLVGDEVKTMRHFVRAVRGPAR
jgi:sugar lactone lactonase YvrE